MRYVLELSVVRRTESGARDSGHRTHIITLSNPEAVDRVVDTIKDGVAGWDDVVKQDDVLEYDDKLD